mgnify:CR=1 FL=1
MSYIDLIKDRAKVDKKTIVLPESNDKRTLIAAAKILEEKIADIIMIGDEEKIMDGAGWLEVDLTGLKIINPQKTEKLDEYINVLYETRKAKGMTPEKASAPAKSGARTILPLPKSTTSTLSIVLDAETGIFEIMSENSFRLDSIFPRPGTSCGRLPTNISEAPPEAMSSNLRRVSGCISRVGGTMTAR